MQVEVINAKFKNGSHDYSFNPNGLELKVGDYVIVDTEKGREMACITKSKYMLDEKDLREPLKNVLEICDNEEVKLANENYKKAEGLYDEIILLGLLSILLLTGELILGNLLKG